jgi:hypothetical protein
MPTSLTLNDTVVVSDNQVSADLSGEVVILGMKQGAYFGVDAAGARIWELLQTPRRLGDVVATLTAEYAVPEEQCATDVLAFVEDLASQGLVKCDAVAAP